MKKSSTKKGKKNINKILLKISLLLLGMSVNVVQAAGVKSTELSSVGEQKTLIILLRFKDSKSVPFAKEEFHEVFFEGEIQKIYKEMSYGKMWLSGDVAGWYTLPDKIHYEHGCEPYFAGASTEQEDEVYKHIKDDLIKDSINVLGYDRFIILYDGCTRTSYNFGMADLSFENTSHRASVIYLSLMIYERSWNLAKHFDDMDGRNSYGFRNEIVHELGHSLGIQGHSNKFDCGNKILHGKCSSDEYCNDFDVMGFGTFAIHFSSYWKELLGWFENDDILEIKKSGRYTLYLLEENQGVRLLKIPIDRDGNTFYLEYRKPVGYDKYESFSLNTEGQGGLFVNLILKGINSISLLDFSPDSPEGHTRSHVSLRPNHIFYDYKNGIGIGPIKIKENSLDIDIKFFKPDKEKDEKLLEISSYPPAPSDDYTRDINLIESSFSHIITKVEYFKVTKVEGF